MSKLRITPLNIASALILTWLLWQVLYSDLGFGGIGWILLLLVAVVFADQFFRVTLKSLKRVWLAQGIFLLFVVLALLVIRVW